MIRSQAFRRLILLAGVTLAIAAFCTPAFARASASTVHPADDGVRVIIRLKGDSLGRMKASLRDTPKSRLNERLRAQKTSLEGQFRQVERLIERAEPGRTHDFYRYDWVVNGIGTTVAEGTIAELEKHPLVVSVSRDSEYELDLSSTVPFTRAPEVWNDLGFDGTGVTVAVIDSGVDYMHPDLGGGFGPGFKVRGGYDFADNDPDPMADGPGTLGGHGTHVAGIAAADGAVVGVASGADLLAYKVLQSGTGIFGAGVIASIDAAVDPDGDPGTDDGADVINLSLGSTMQPYSDSDMALAVDDAFDAGVISCCAAGNYGPTAFEVHAPAAAYRAIAVANTDGPYSGTGEPHISPDSSRGPGREGWFRETWDIKPDITAPGVARSVERDGGYGTRVGTSMSAPHVAGVAALVKQAHPEWDAETVSAAVVETARRISTASVFEQGSGVVDAFAAVSVPAVALPDALPFGVDHVMEPVWSSTKVIRLRNLSDHPLTYAAQVSGDATMGVTLVVDPAVLTVAPGEEATAAVRLTVDNAATPPAPSPWFFYSGRVDFVSDEGTLTVPWSFGRDYTQPPSTPAVAGPTNVQTGAEESYSFSGAAFDARYLKHFWYEVDWGDGISALTYANLSGGGLGSDVHSFAQAGTYSVKVRAILPYSDATSPWSSALTVAVSDDLVNLPPSAPVADLPEWAVVASGISIQTQWSDPEYGRCTVQIDDNGTVTNWQASWGTFEAAVPHTFNTTGDHTVRMRTVDPWGLASEWTTPTVVHVHQAPLVLNGGPSGPTSVRAGAVASYSAQTFDPDYHLQRVEFEWGDGTTLTDLGPNLTWHTRTHTWSTPGTYTVTATAVDEHDGRSAPYSMTVSVWGLPAPAQATGPVLVVSGESATYSASAVDPSGMPITYLFAWGDGTETSVGPVPSGQTAQASHAWTASGAMSVTVRVVDSLGILSDPSEPLEVAVNAVPCAPSLGAELFLTGESSESLQMYATDSDDPVLTYMVDWGDGSEPETFGGFATPGAISAAHTYAVSGSYQVAVSASDGHGGVSANSTREVYVSARPAQAQVTGPAGVPVGASTEFSFQASEPDGEQVRFLINWGDGTTEESNWVSSGTALTLAHAYGQAGYYVLQATAVDSAGAQAADAGGFVVAASMPPLKPEPPVGPTSAGLFQYLAFQVAGFDPDSSAIWYEMDWGDGTIEKDSFPRPPGVPIQFSHLWSASGTYAVRVRCSDGVFTSEWSEPLNVVVNRPPSASAPWLSRTTMGTGDVVTATVGGTDPEGGPVRYTVHWGDGSSDELGVHPSGTQVSVSHAYAEVGSYNPSVAVEDSVGATGSASSALTVIARPAASVPTGPDRVTPGQYAVYSTVGTDPNGSSVRYTIDWGDGTAPYYYPWLMASGSTRTAGHTFSSAGRYPVRAKVGNASGVDSLWSEPLTVTVNTPPSGSSVTVIGSPLPGNELLFDTWVDDPDAGQTLRFDVDWGEGQTSTESGLSRNRTFARTWSTAGSRTVVVKVTDSLGDSVQTTVTVTVNTAPDTPQAPQGQTYVQTGTSGAYRFLASDPDGHMLRYVVSWGDGSAEEVTELVPSGTELTLTHAWAQAGIRNITVRAEDALGGQSGQSAALPVTVNTPPVFEAIVFGAPIQTAGAVAHVTFTATDADDEPYLQYHVDWGDGSAMEPSGENGSQPASHQYMTGGTYVVSAYVTDGWGGVSNTMTCAVDVNSAPAKPGAPAGPALAVSGEPATFSFRATDAEGDRVRYRIYWAPAYGEAAEVTDWASPGETVTVAHTYSSKAWHSVFVVAEDEHGFLSPQSDTLMVEVDSRPNAGEAPTGPPALAPGATGNYGVSGSDPDGDQVSFMLDWGDGSTSSSGLLDSGSWIQLPHSWPTPGVYLLRMRVTDERGLSSGWSLPTTVTVASPNTAPAAPAVGGARAARPATAISMTFTVGADPENQQSSVVVDWGDGLTSTLGPASGGTVLNTTHAWSAAGTYLVRAKTRDSMGAESTWSNTATVTVSSSVILYVNGIGNVSKTTSSKGIETLNFPVWVSTQGGVGYSGAAVTASLKLPSGSTVALSGSTSTGGLVTLKYAGNKLVPKGSYTLTVTGVSKRSTVYAPASNVVGSRTYVVQ